MEDVLPFVARCMPSPVFKTTRFKVWVRSTTILSDLRSECRAPNMGECVFISPQMMAFWWLRIQLLLRERFPRGTQKFSILSLLNRAMIVVERYWTCSVISFISLTKKPVEICVSISPGFAPDSAGFWSSFAAGLAFLALCLRLFLSFGIFVWLLWELPGSVSETASADSLYFTFLLLWQHLHSWYASVISGGWPPFLFCPVVWNIMTGAFTNRTTMKCSPRHLGHLALF